MALVANVFGPVLNFLPLLLLAGALVTLGIALFNLRHPAARAALRRTATPRVLWMITFVVLAASAWIPPGVTQQAIFGSALALAAVAAGVTGWYWWASHRDRSN